jgi:hypothetical protein
LDLRLWATRGTLEEHNILVRITFVAGVARGSLNGSIVIFRGLFDNSRRLGFSRFNLVENLAVSHLTILAKYGIAELFKALSPDAKSLSNLLLLGVISEKDEGLHARKRVDLLVDAPKHVVEQRPECYWDPSRPLGSREFSCLASSVRERLLLKVFAAVTHDVIVV